MKATVSLTPSRRFSGEPEIIESVDVTSCMLVIQQLKLMADFVNKSPSEHDTTSLVFAYQIDLIYKALKPQLDRIGIIYGRP